MWIPMSSVPVLFPCSLSETKSRHVRTSRDVHAVPTEDYSLLTLKRYRGPGTGNGDGKLNEKLATGNGKQEGGTELETATERQERAT